jgi:hypothetical protein
MRRTMNIYIDFDDTICPEGDVLNKPFDNAIEVIQKFKANGNRIIIYSCRSSKDVLGEHMERATQHMLDYLRRWGIPYDSVFYGKPNYDVVIDDKAIGFRDNWKQIGDAIKGN